MNEHPENTRGDLATRGVSLDATFAAFRYRNYRLWFVGQLVSLVGTWMQTTAQGYLVFELTHSPVFLGYVGFAAGIPSWLFTLYGGVVADRISRRTLLILTQTAMMVLAVILAFLTFTHLVQPWQIILLAFLLGIANAFDAPARQAFVLELVSREDLTNAIALNSTMFNSATAVGPAVAGLTYAALGPGWCFTINAASFIAVIIALAMMRITMKPLIEKGRSAAEDLRKGLRFVVQNKIVRSLVLYLAVVSLFGMGFVTLIPAWAVTVLGGDAATNGFLQSARGVGAMIGALLTAALARQGVRGKLVTTGTFAFPILLIFFAMIHWLPLSLAALVGIGWGMMFYLNSSNSIVQTEVPDDLRGRVMAIYTLAFFGLLPFGSLLAGNLADWLGAPQVVILGGSVLLLASGIVFWQVPELRRML